MSIKQAVDDINDKTKIKAGFYFSLKDLKELTTKTHRDCYPNALYALNANVVVKLCNGLRLFTDDRQVTDAVLGIFEVIVEAVNKEQIKSFISEGGLLSVYDLITSSTANYDSDLALRIFSLSLEKCTDNYIYVKLLNYVGHHCVALSETDKFEGLLKVCVSISDKQNLAELDSLVINNFIDLYINELKTKDRLEIRKMLALIIRQLVQNLPNGFEDYSTLLHLKKNCIESVPEYRNIATCIIKAISYEKVLTIIQEAINNRPLTKPMSQRLEIVSYNPSIQTILTENNLVPKLIKACNEQLKSKDVVNYIGFFNIIKQLIIDGDADVIESKIIEQAFNIFVTAKEPEKVLSIVPVIEGALSHKIYIDQFVDLFFKRECIESFYKTNNITNAYIFSLIVLKLSEHTSTALMLAKDKVITGILSRISTSQYPLSILNYASCVCLNIVSQLTSKNEAEMSQILYICSQIEKIRNSQLKSNLLKILYIISQKAGDNNSLMTEAFNILINLYNNIEVFSDDYYLLKQIFELHDCSETFGKIISSSATWLKNTAFEANLNTYILCSLLLPTSVTPAIKKFPNELNEFEKAIASMLVTVIKQPKSSIQKDLLKLICIIRFDITQSLDHLGKALEKLASAADISTNSKIITAIVEAFTEELKRIEADAATLEQGDELANGYGSVASATVLLFKQVNDNKESIEPICRLITSVAQFNSHCCIEALSKHDVVKALSVCLQKLKMCPNLQTFILATFKELVKTESSSIINACRQGDLLSYLRMGIIHNGQNYNNNRLAMYLCFRIMPQQFLESHLRSLINDSLSALKNKKFTEANDNISELALYLSDENVLNFLSKSAFPELISLLFSYCRDSKLIDSRQIILSTLLSLIQQLHKSQLANKIFFNQCNGCQNLIIIIQNCINSDPLENKQFIDLVLSEIPEIIPMTIADSKNCSVLIDDIFVYLQQVDYDSTSCDAAIKFIMFLPNEYLKSCKNYHKLIAKLVKLYSSNNKTEVTLVNRCIMALAKNVYCCNLLRAKGAEAQIFKNIKEHVIDLEDLLNTAVVFTSNYAELDDSVILARVNQLCKLILEANTEKIMKLALRILVNYAQSAVSYEPFQNNYLFTRVYKFLSKLSDKDSSIQPDLDILLTLLSADDVLASIYEKIYESFCSEQESELLFKQLQDETVNSASVYFKLKLTDPKLMYCVIALITEKAVERIDSAPEKRKFQYISSLSGLLSRLLQNAKISTKCFDQNLDSANKKNGEETSKTAAIIEEEINHSDTSAVRRLSTTSTNIANEIKKHKDIDSILLKTFDNRTIDLVYALSSSTFNSEATTVLSYLMKAPLMRRRALAVLGDDKLVCKAYRLIATTFKENITSNESDDEEIIALVMSFLSQLTETIEGHYINMRSVKMLYGSQNAPIITICVNLATWTQKWPFIATDGLLLINNTLVNEKTENIITPYHELILQYVSQFASIGIIPLSTSLLVYAYMLNFSNISEKIVPHFTNNLNEIKTQYNNKSIPEVDIEKVMSLVREAGTTIKTLESLPSILDCVTLGDDEYRNKIPKVTCLNQICNDYLAILSFCYSKTGNTTNNNQLVTKQNITTACFDLVITKVTMLLESSCLTDKNNTLYDSVRDFFTFCFEHDEIVQLVKKDSKLTKILEVLRLQNFIRLLDEEEDKLASYFDFDLNRLYEINTKWLQLINIGKVLNSVETVSIKEDLQIVKTVLLHCSKNINSKGILSKLESRALEALCLLDQETTNLSIIFEQAFSTQTNPLIIDKYISTFIKLQNNSPKAVESFLRNINDYANDIAKVLEKNNYDSLLIRLKFIRLSSQLYNSSLVESLFLKTDYDKINKLVNYYETDIEASGELECAKEILLLIAQFQEVLTKKKIYEYLFSLINLPFFTTEVNIAIVKLHTYDSSIVLAKEKLEQLSKCISCNESLYTILSTNFRNNSAEIKAMILDSSIIPDRIEQLIILLYILQENKPITSVITFVKPNNVTKDDNLSKRLISNDPASKDTQDKTKVEVTNSIVTQSEAVNAYAYCIKTFTMFLEEDMYDNLVEHDFPKLFVSLMKLFVEIADTILSDLVASCITCATELGDKDVLVNSALRVLITSVLSHKQFKLNVISAIFPYLYETKDYAQLFYFYSLHKESCPSLITSLKSACMVDSEEVLSILKENNIKDFDEELLIILASSVNDPLKLQDFMPTVINSKKMLTAFENWYLRLHQEFSTTLVKHQNLLISNDRFSSNASSKSLSTSSALSREFSKFRSRQLNSENCSLNDNMDEAVSLITKAQTNALKQSLSKNNKSHSKSFGENYKPALFTSLSSTFSNQVLNNKNEVAFTPTNETELFDRLQELYLKTQETTLLISNYLLNYNREFSSIVELLLYHFKFEQELCNTQRKFYNTLNGSGLASLHSQESGWSCDSICYEPFTPLIVRLNVIPTFINYYASRLSEEKLANLIILSLSQASSKIEILFVAILICAKKTDNKQIVIEFAKLLQRINFKDLNTRFCLASMIVNILSTFPRSCGPAEYSESLHSIYNYALSKLTSKSPMARQAMFKYVHDVLAADFTRESVREAYIAKAVYICDQTDASYEKFSQHALWELPLCTLM